MCVKRKHICARHYLNNNAKMQLFYLKIFFRISEYLEKQKFICDVLLNAFTMEMWAHYIIFKIFLKSTVCIVEYIFKIEISSVKNLFFIASSVRWLYMHQLLSTITK